MEKSSIASASKRRKTSSSVGDHVCDVSTKEYPRESIDMVFDCVISYIQDGSDRNSFSLVCRKWYELDSLTRKHVTVHLYYATTPSRLLQRFPFLESLTLKGGPGGFAYELNIDITPWIQQIAVSCNCLKALHLCSVKVNNSDLELLARTRGKQLRVLKITRCIGVFNVGLFHIARYCNNLQTLYIEKNRMIDTKGKWLHELALHSTCIESLIFDDVFPVFDVKDLALLAKNCSQSLVCLKLPGGLDPIDLRDFFKLAARLEDFSSAKFGDEVEEYVGFQFPSNLRSITLDLMKKTSFPIVLPFAHQLIELNLRYANLNEDDHCFFVQRCPNLEVLYTLTFGNKLLQVIGQFCKKLRKLKAKPRMFHQGHGSVSKRGLIALSQECLELECLHINVIGITNKVFECIGAHLKNLRDFKIILHGEGRMRDRPLDNGVQALLTGCTKLERLYIHLRPGRLTDVGLLYIGKYGLNLRYLFLGYSGESDAGLVELSKGCPKLRKLGMMGCPFSEQVYSFVFNITSLRYMWACMKDFESDGMIMTRDEKMYH